MKEQIYTVKVNENGEFWYKDPECEILHREKGPAVIYSDGTKSYWKNGQLHNDNGPAVIYSNGAKEYYKNGLRHNDNGPAVIRSNGAKSYWKNGQLHNDNGPAFIGSDGYKEYLINGKFYSEKEYWKVAGQKTCDGKVFVEEETGKKYKLVEI